MFILFYYLKRSFKNKNIVNIYKKNSKSIEINNNNNLK